MKGHIIGQHLKTWQSGNSLNDGDLAELIKGLEFIVDFCDETHLTPLGSYYATQLMSMRSAQTARKEDKKKVRKPIIGAVAECESDIGYKSHFDEVCAQAVAQHNTCECCGKDGLTYKGFLGYGHTLAFSICPHCGDEQEF